MLRVKFPVIIASELVLTEMLDFILVLLIDGLAGKVFLLSFISVNHLPTSLVIAKLVSDG